MTTPPPLPPAATRPAAAASALMLALLLAACATPGQPATEPSVASAATGAATRWPASVSGACYLLDQSVIVEHLELTLAVAAARDRGGTHSCVRRAEASGEPELVLTVTPTTVDVPTFVHDLTPSGATAVSQLGKAAYHGPGLQVGWLSGDNRLLTLSLVPPAGENPDRYTGGLLELARAIDRARH